MNAVVIDKKRFIDNLKMVGEFLKRRNCDLVVSTKSLRLSKDVMRIFTDTQRFYDSNSDNIKLLIRAGKETISRDQITQSRHSIVVTRKNELTTLNKNVHSLYLYFDFGDGREGFSLNEVPTLLPRLKKLSPKNLTIASHIGCMSDKRPSRQYFSKFLSVRRFLEQNGLKVSKFSLGGSDCLPFLDLFDDDVCIELRIGNAILFGSYDKVKSTILPLNKNNVFFTTRILKRLDSGKNLCEFGYSQLEQRDICSGSHKIIKQSAGYSIVETKTTQKKELLRIPITYEGLSKLTENRNVQTLLM